MRSSTQQRAWGLAVLALFVCSGHVSLEAGCNANGIDDLEEISSGAAADCNLNEIPDECEFAPLDLQIFGAEIVLPGSPRQPVAGDFDGNGFEDLAVGTWLSDKEGATVQVLLSGGDGTLGQSEVLLPGELTGLLVGHFDSDGSPDLAVLGSAAVTVLWNDGNGGFATTTDVPLPTGSAAVHSLDADGNGIQDLVVVNSSEPRLDLFMGNGNRTFSAQAPVALVELARTVAPADYDGDGAVDLAVTYRSSMTISLLRNEGFQDDGGTFSKPQDSDLLLQGAFNVVAADLDADGDPDIVAGNAADIAVTENDGGTLGTSTVYDEGRPNSLTTADVDADGDLDILVGTTFSSNLLIRHNNDLDFSLTSELQLGLNPRGVTAFDLDADGDQDVAALAGEGSNARLLLVATGNLLRPESLRFAASTKGTRGLPHSIALADFNRDGIIDVATPNGSKSTVSVLLGKSDATYENAVTYRFSVAVETILQSIAAGDLDGDGFPDIVAGDLRMQVLHVRYNAGDATFREGTCYPVGTGPRMVITADMNGDGREDILSANDSNNSVSILFGLGERNFAERQDVEVASSPVSLAANDFDGDGALDLAVASRNAREFSIHRNLGAGTFAPPVVYLVLGRPNYIGVGLFDTDSALDLAVVHDGAVTLFAGDGQGAFTERGSQETYQIPFSLATGDVDGDGLLDVVTANPNGAAFGSVSVLLGNGDGTLRPAVRYAVGAECRLVATADIEGDGDVDIISANRSSENITVLRNDTPPPVLYAEAICTATEFFDLSVPADVPASAARRLRYFVAPTVVPEVPPVIFEDTDGTSSPAVFLAAAFPATYGNLTDETFAALALERAVRQLFVGELLEFRSAAGRVYGFTIDVHETDPAELPTLEETTRVFEALRGAVALEELAYSPLTEQDRVNAALWAEPSFPILNATEAVVFQRGDVDASGNINITDGTLVLSHLFFAGFPIPCVKAADADDSNRLDVSDALYILNFLFLGGPQPAVPFEECGSDPSEDAFSCEGFAPCA